MIFSMSFEPLTYLFLGRRGELSPYEVQRSATLPSIYTVAGAILTVLSLETSTPFQRLEELVGQGGLRILGPYVEAVFAGGRERRYFVPAPFNLVTTDGVHYVRARIVERAVVEGGFANLFGAPRAVLAAHPKARPRPDNVLVELKPEGGAWRVDHGSVALLEVSERPVTSFEMDRERKVVARGTLYSKVLIERLDLVSLAYGRAERVRLRCDVEVLDEDLASKVEKIVGKQLVVQLGGEGGLALACAERLEAPLLSLSKAQSKTRLAVSHIMVAKGPDGSYAALDHGELQWFVGRVKLVGGWLLREGRMKKHVPALAPGSVFKVKERAVQRLEQPEEWYLKLLSVSIPYHP